MPTLAGMGQTYQEKVVAAVLMAEAWCQGEKGMTAVGEVIATRAQWRHITPLRVVTAQNKKSGIHAFACLNGTTPDRLVSRYQKQEDFALALSIARSVVRAPDQLPGVARGADHFTRKEEKPYWARGHRPVAIIGDHAFYRLRAQTAP